MDPITLIVSSLAAGAAAGLKPTAEKIITDAYDGLKTLIKRRYSRVRVDVLDLDPADADGQQMLRKDLEKAHAAEDPELVTLAKELIRKVDEHAPETAEAVGIDLRIFRVKGKLEIEDVEGAGTGVRGEDWEIGGDATFKQIRGGEARRSNP